MSAVKGEQKKGMEGSFTKYVGFTVVEVHAINPTRKEKNRLFNIDGKEDDEEIKYLDTDREGNDRVRLDFYLYSEKLSRYFVRKIWVSNKKVKSSEAKGSKPLFVNSVCASLYWPDVDSLPLTFTDFTDKKDKTKSIGKKRVWEAIAGESELLNFVRGWLGRLNFYRPTCEIIFDVNRLLKNDTSELRELINSTWDAPFVPLFGVETNQDDPNEQYQAIWDKLVLPAKFMSYIEGKQKIKDDWDKRTWEYFEKEVTGDHGFKAFHELCPIKEYKREDDPAVSGEEPKDEVTPVNSNY